MKTHRSDPEIMMPDGKRLLLGGIKVPAKRQRYHSPILSRLPVDYEPWPLYESHSGQLSPPDSHEKDISLDTESWKWPKRPVIFIADPHADAEAFIASLVASGAAVKTGLGYCDFKLTSRGRRATIIIGGDCLDKGPSNLNLLRAVRHLMLSHPRVKLLAGNHDMRLFMGIHAMGLPRSPGTEHLFVRMGDKAIPLLEEIHRTYFAGEAADSSIPDDAECKKRLYPGKNWFQHFPEYASSYMRPAAIERELKRMRKKINGFEKACHKAGFRMRDVYAIAMKCRELFIEPDGDFAWFYQNMQLAYRKGAFLFVHAGLDDSISQMIQKQGVRSLNNAFRDHIERDLFRFYFGGLANTMRTKYRPADLPLSESGVKRLRKAGLHVVVHGHINRTQGQRMALKQGLLHVESDVTLDRGSRKKEGLDDFGIGVTTIEPEGQIIGLSCDYPYAKVFSSGNKVFTDSKST